MSANPTYEDAEGGKQGSDGRELLWGVCGLKGCGRGPSLGGVGGGIEPDLLLAARESRHHATSDAGPTLRLSFEEMYVRRLTAVTIRWPQFSQHQE